MPVAMPTRATSVRVPVRVLSPKSDGLPFEHPETAAFIDPDELFSADFSPSSAVPGSGLSPSSPLVLSRCSSARGMSGHGSQSLGSPTALLPGISGSKLGMPARRESIYSRSALSSAAASWTRMSGPPPEPAPELVAEDNQGGAIMGSIMQFGRIQSQQPRVAATNGDPERAVAQPSESTNNSSTGTIDLRSKEGKATLFTNYMHMRQERALKNWQKHSIAWQTAEEKLAQGLGKVPLMSKTHLYRASVEQHHLIEEAICVLEAHYDYWLRGLRIGHDLLGLNFPLPPQGPRPLERVAWPLDARNSGPDSKLGPVPTYEDGLSRNERSYLEKRRAELEQTISALDPAGGRTHARDLAGISIIGQRISSASTARASNVDARLAATMSREIQARLSATTTASASASEKTAVTGAASQLSQLRSPSKASVKHEKTHLQLSTATIAFDTAPDQVAASCVSVYNPTDCAIRFKWVHHRPELQFGSPGAALPATNTEVVYLPVRSGILLPQSAFDFHVMFKAPRPGWYVEEWVLETTPKCCVSIVGSPDVGHGRIKISGVCTEEDSTKTARDAWFAQLTRDTALAAARSVIETMLDNVWLSAESKARGPAISAEQATYAGRNSDYQLRYTPQFVAQLRGVHASILSDHLHLDPKLEPWDLRIASLFNMTEFIMDTSAREQVLRDLNEMLAAHEGVGTTPTRPDGSAGSTMIRRAPLSAEARRRRTAAARAWWVEALDRIGDDIPKLRRGMGLPCGPERACIRKFQVSEEEAAVFSAGSPSGASDAKSASTEKKGAVDRKGVRTFALYIYLGTISADVFPCRAPARTLETQRQPPHPPQEVVKGLAKTPRALLEVPPGPPRVGLRPQMLGLMRTDRVIAPQLLPSGLAIRPTLGRWSGQKRKDGAAGWLRQWSEKKLSPFWMCSGKFWRPSNNIPILILPICIVPFPVTIRSAILIMNQIRVYIRLATLLVAVWMVNAAAPIQLQVPSCLPANVVKRFGWQTPTSGIAGQSFLQQPPANVILESDGWASANLTGYVAAMLLNDVMGVNVTLMQYPGSRNSYVRPSTGEVQVNVEIWPKQSLYTQYVTQDGTDADFGLLGYVGKISWYINTAVANANPNIIMDSWRSFSQQAVLNLLPPVGSTPLKRNAKGDLLCTSAAGYNFCGTDGYFTPPQCQGALRSQCREFWHPDPSYSQGQNEQRIVTLGLKLVVAYVGYDEIQTLFAACAGQSATACVGYWWKPEVLPSIADLTTVNLPPYTATCFSQFDYNKVGQVGNSLSCDWPIIALMKLGQASLGTTAPQVTMLLKSISFSDIDINLMLADYAQHGSDTIGAACRWLTANQNGWQSWIPKTPPGYLRSLDQISPGEAVAIVVLILAALLLALVISLLVCLYKLRLAPLVIAQAPPFIAAIAVGVLFIGLDVILETLTPTSAVCTLQTWAMYLGGFLVLGSIFIKTIRIRLIFGNQKLRKMNLKTARALAVLGGIMTMAILLLVAWTLTAQPMPSTSIVSDTTFTYSCDTSDSMASKVITLLLFVSLSVLFVSDVVLGFQVRNVDTMYNESKYIANATYAILIAAAIALPVARLGVHFRVNYMVKNLLTEIAAFTVVGMLVARPLVEAYVAEKQKENPSVFTPQLRMVRGSRANRKSIAGRVFGAASPTESKLNLDDAVIAGQGFAIQNQFGIFRPWTQVDLVLVQQPAPAILIVPADKSFQGRVFTAHVSASLPPEATQSSVPGTFLLTFRAKLFLVQAQDASGAQMWVEAINKCFTHANLRARKNTESRGAASGENFSQPGSIKESNNMISDANASEKQLSPK